MKNKNKFIQFLDKIHQDRNTIFENEILIIKHTLQNNNFNCEFEDILKNYDFDGYELSSSQNSKGRDYLDKRFLTKCGNISKSKLNNYVSYDFRFMVKFCPIDFTFTGFAKITNGVINFYEPIYTCWNKENYNEHYTYFHFNGIDYELKENGDRNYELISGDNYIGDYHYIFVEVL